MMKGERMVAIRAAMEQQPIAVFLITVGKSSEVTEYTMQKAEVTPNFPSISRSTATAGKSEGKKLFLIQIIIFGYFTNIFTFIFNHMESYLRRKCFGAKFWLNI